MWYRIELNRDGSVASCAEVEACAVEGRHVRYVEADSKANALTLVARWHRSNEQKRARREKARALGLCNCGRRRAIGKQSCQTCLDNTAASHARLAAGGPRRRRLASRTQDEQAAVIRRTEQTTRRNEKANAEVFGSTGKEGFRRAFARALAEFDHRTPADFRAWLVAEIAALTPKKSLLQEVLEQHPAAAE